MAHVYKTVTAAAKTSRIGNVHPGQKNQKTQTLLFEPF